MSLKFYQLYKSNVFLSPISSYDCSLIIKNLKITRQDINNVPVRVLNDIHNLISPILSVLINDCFAIGLHPLCLKLARVTPIFKSGDTSDIKNYMSISILPLLNKNFDKCIDTQLHRFVTECKWISPHQYGFLKGRSTEQAVSVSMKSIYSALNSKEIT